MHSKAKPVIFWGGVELVTEKVIDAAGQLEAIVFTGTGFKGFIPAWQTALDKGIKIANAPHANAYAVAEWMVAATLAMQRNLFSLGRTGKDTFKTVQGLKHIRIGIIGLGHIGGLVAEMFTGLGVEDIVYWSRSEKEVKYEHKELNDLLSSSDIVCLCVSEDAGKDYFDRAKLEAMKRDALLVSLTHPGTIHEEALLKALSEKRIRAASDYTPKLKEFEKLSLDIFYCSNESAAFNTLENLKTTSDMATQSMINLLQTGKDQYLVN